MKSQARLVSNIIRAKPGPLESLLPLNICTAGSRGSGGVPACRKKIRRVSSLNIYTHFHSRIPPCPYDCISDASSIMTKLSMTIYFLPPGFGMTIEILCVLSLWYDHELFSSYIGMTTTLQSTLFINHICTRCRSSITACLVLTLLRLYTLHTTLLNSKCHNSP